MQDRESLGSERRQPSPSDEIAVVEVAFDVNGAPRRIHGRGAVLAALAASGLLGAGLRAAASPGAASPRAVLRAAAPEPPQSSLVPAETAAVGFEELPNLIAIEPGDGALDAELDTVLRLTFDAPIDPESVGYLSVNLEEQGSGAVVGRLSVEGAVVTYAPIRSLVLDHEYSVQVDALMAGSGWIELGAARFRTRDGLWEHAGSAGARGRQQPGAGDRSRG